TFTVEELIHWMLTLSDNPSTDVLIRRLGGVGAVATALDALDVRGVSVRANEAGLHARTAALKANVEEVHPDAAPAYLEAALLEDPNAATAIGAARGLARLARGELLGSEATERLLAILFETSTGVARLQAGLPEDWRLAHKTGTGGEIGQVSLGTNDLGLLVAPDGRQYAVAAFLAGADESQAAREARIAALARAVVAYQQDCI
ncbi:MAG: serine hydrolase, partial [Bdellovibrionales bacterium]|nr:serine hydrolase [Bdellovibrionales bacterium]